MENKYKVGDKLYFGYFTGAEIMVEGCEITNVYGNIIEVRNTNTGWFGKVHFSWLKDKNYSDTFEEAYNEAVKSARTKLAENITEAEKEVCIRKKKLAEFEEKYGKEKEDAEKMC